MYLFQKFLTFVATSFDVTAARNLHIFIASKKDNELVLGLTHI